MDREKLQKVVEDQREELERKRQIVLCERRERESFAFESDLAQVVIGVRRSGKSTLCAQALWAREKPFAYVNFDDERLATLKGEDLNELLEALYAVYGTFDALFLDEMQNLPEWFLFVNRLLRRGLQVVVTGSNAKLLSSELATHLTGRHLTVELSPFSFAEVCAFKGVPQGVSTEAVGLRRQAFTDYLRSGGFPEIVKHPALAPRYIPELLENILTRDIQPRARIRHMEPLRQLAAYLLDTAPTCLNYQALAKRLGDTCTPKTAHHYVDLLKRAYLLIGIHKYDTKRALRLRNEKVYPVDVALMHARPNAFAGENLGWRLETLVFIELLRRTRPFGQDVYYYTDPHGEVDFVVCQGRRPLALYQACYSLSDPKTRNREIATLLRVGAKLACPNLFIISGFDRDRVERKGLTVQILPAWDWLITLPEAPFGAP